MPKRRISRGARRLGPAARSHLRLIRELQPDELQIVEHAMLTTHDIDEQAAQVVELNPPPIFGDTIVLAQTTACTSCPTEITEGAEGTYIDGELNCSECTWEARHPHG